MVNRNTKAGTIIRTEIKLRVYNAPINEVEENEQPEFTNPICYMILKEDMNSTHDDIEVIINEEQKFLLKSELLDSITSPDIIYERTVSREDIHYQLGNLSSGYPVNLELDKFKVIYPFKPHDDHKWFDVGDIVSRKVIEDQMFDRESKYGLNILFYVDIDNYSNKENNKSDNEVDKKDVSVDDLDKIYIKDNKIYKKV